jgi:hypothetical protein
MFFLTVSSTIEGCLGNSSGKQGHPALDFGMAVRAKQHAFPGFGEQNLKRECDSGSTEGHALVVRIDVMKFKRADEAVIPADATAASGIRYEQLLDFCAADARPIPRDSAGIGSTHPLRARNRPHRAPSRSVPRSEVQPLLRRAVAQPAAPSACAVGTAPASAAPSLCSDRRGRRSRRSSFRRRPTALTVHAGFPPRAMSDPSSTSTKVGGRSR